MRRIFQCFREEEVNVQVVLLEKAAGEVKMLLFCGKYNRAEAAGSSGEADVLQPETGNYFALPE